MGTTYYSDRTDRRTWICRGSCRSRYRCTGIQGGRSGIRWRTYHLWKMQKLSGRAQRELQRCQRCWGKPERCVCRISGYSRFKCMAVQSGNWWRIICDLWSIWKCNPYCIILRHAWWRCADHRCRADWDHGSGDRKICRSKTCGNHGYEPVPSGSGSKNGCDQMR